MTKDFFRAKKTQHNLKKFSVGIELNNFEKFGNEAFQPLKLSPS